MMEDGLFPCEIRCRGDIKAQTRKSSLREKGGENELTTVLVVGATGNTSPIGIVQLISRLDLDVRLGHTSPLRVCDVPILPHLKFILMNTVGVSSIKRVDRYSRDKENIDAVTMPVESLCGPDW